MTAAREPEPVQEQVDAIDAIESEPEEVVDPDEVAEEAPIDPTPQEVDEYRSLIGDEVAEDGAGAVGHGRRGPRIPEF
ncbi:hypothetical protein FHX81_6767 [Saccharothrix saharensis]|uniref:Uncharacterized protein n=1 Tax=Saccharothrix saharensis TaxID=571190 RepID=A0A543JNB9_9PSEU|nr:hypothetical protein [Saccharothrix saharensis]TQM84323.1 hypothetical protein FHX81_6767 [Saccharothrix saharensis]